MAKNQSTLEKFLKAKEMYDMGKFTSIEDAAKAAKISPATYYNYAKKVVGDSAQADQEATKEVFSYLSKDNSSELVRTVSEIKTLQQKLDALKEKVINMIMVRG